MKYFTSLSNFIWKIGCTSGVQTRNPFSPTAYVKITRVKFNCVNFVVPLKYIPAARNPVRSHSNAVKVSKTGFNKLKKSSFQQKKNEYGFPVPPHYVSWQMSKSTSIASFLHKHTPFIYQLSLYYVTPLLGSCQSLKGVHEEVLRTYLY